MLKNLMIFVSVIMLLSNPAYSQETKKTLTAQALLLYQQGNFEKAIEAAEKVVAMEKAAQPPDALSYVNSLVNAARMKQGYIVELQNKLDGENLAARDRIELYEKNSRTAAETEMLLRQVLELNESGGRAQTAQTADVKSELATLVQKYTPIAAKPSIQSSRARIDEAEKLLTESLALNEQIRGKTSEQTLAVVLQTADFYAQYVNFEKALPFYERYIGATENKGVKIYPELPSALRSYASILYAGFQDRESAEVIGKLEALTQNKESSFREFNFHLRSKDSVAHASETSRTLSIENESFRQRQKLLNQTLTGSRRESPTKLVRVRVRVVVDENGRVIEAVADNQDKKLRSRAEQTVSKWLIRPFSYKGAAQKLRGILVYTEL